MSSSSFGDEANSGPEEEEEEDGDHEGVDQEGQPRIKKTEDYYTEGLIIERRRLKRRLHNSHVALLVAILLILVLATALVTVVWLLIPSQQQSRDDAPPEFNRKADQVNSTNPQPATAAATTSSICQTPACLRASLSILDSLDTSVSPCTDLYGYVCNRWAMKKSIPKGQPVWSVLSQRRLDNMRIIREILEQPEVSPSPESLSSYSPAVKARHFYESCMDPSGLREKIGAQPLHDIIKDVGGWSLTGDGNRTALSNFSLMDKLASVHTYNTDALFSWFVSEGERNLQQLYLRQGGLTLPSAHMYVNSDAANNSSGNSTVSEADKILFDYIASIVKLLGGDATKYAHDIKGIVLVEKNLARIRTEPADMIGLQIPLRRVDKLLSAESPWFGNMTAFMRDVSATYLSYGSRNNNDSSSSKSSPIQDKTLVWVQTKYFTKLSWLMDIYLEPGGNKNVTNPGGYVSRKLKRYLNNYLTWRAIVPYLGYLSKGFSRAGRAHQGVTHGTVGHAPRWKTCVNAATSAFGFAIAPAFIQRVGVGEETRNQVDEMIDVIRDVFISRLDNLDWIKEDVETVRQIKEKTKSLSKQIGYPDMILDNAKLESHYETLDVRPDELFLNLVRFRRFRLRQNFESLRRPRDPNDWPLTFSPSTVNAFYSYFRHQMTLPAGVLLSPFSDLSRPAALNFGHLGTYIGHELLHSLDDTGRLFNSVSEISAWWPDNTTEAYNANADCFVRQYQASGVDGKRTLSENLADNGGLAAAFQGYQTWMERKKKQGLEEAQVLPGLPFSGDQLFYIGFAQAHCTKVQPLTKALLALTDSHSPSRVRVNNAVSNAEGFDEIWNCRKETETKKNESQETVGAKNQDGDLNEPGSSAEDMSREVCTMW